MTNLPYEERIKNRSIDWYYNKCIRQYHFIIKSEGANERYKEEIKRLNKIIEKTKSYNKDYKKQIENQVKLHQDKDFIIATYLAIFHDTLEEILEGDD